MHPILHDGGIDTMYCDSICLHLSPQILGMQLVSNMLLHVGVESWFKSSQYGLALASKPDT